MYCFPLSILLKEFSFSEAEWIRQIMGRGQSVFNPSPKPCHMQLICVAAASNPDQFLDVRRRSAGILDKAEEAEDLRAAGTFLRELREQIRLWAELEKKMAENPPQVSFILSDEWIELRTTILYALDPYPEAKLAIVRAIRGPDYDKWDDDGPNPGSAEVKS